MPDTPNREPDTISRLVATGEDACLLPKRPS